MEPDTIAFVALVFIWVGFVLETVVRFRQQMLFRQSTRPPKELESFLDDTFFQTRAFAEDSLNIEAAEDLFHQVLGFFPLLYSHSPSWTCCFTDFPHRNETLTVWLQAKQTELPNEQSLNHFSVTMLALSSKARPYIELF